MQGVDDASQWSLIDQKKCSFVSCNTFVEWVLSVGWLETITPPHVEQSGFADSAPVIVFIHNVGMRFLHLAEAGDAQQVLNYCCILKKESAVFIFPFNLKPKLVGQLRGTSSNRGFLHFKLQLCSDTHSLTHSLKSSPSKTEFFPSLGILHISALACFIF